MSCFLRVLDAGRAPHQPGQHLPERPAVGGRPHGGPHGRGNRAALRGEPLHPGQRLHRHGNVCRPALLGQLRRFKPET